MADSERAQQNIAYLRRLLRERQPEFASVLLALEREFSCPASRCEQDQPGLVTPAAAVIR